VFVKTTAAVAGSKMIRIKILYTFHAAEGINFS
jgi:hypothetical protein